MGLSEDPFAAQGEHKKRIHVPNLAEWTETSAEVFGQFSRDTASADERAGGAPRGTDSLASETLKAQSGSPGPDSAIWLPPSEEQSSEDGESEQGAGEGDAGSLLGAGARRQQREERQEGAGPQQGQQLTWLQLLQLQQREKVLLLQQQQQAQARALEEDSEGTEGSSEDDSESKAGEGPASLLHERSRSEKPGSHRGWSHMDAADPRYAAPMDIKVSRRHGETKEERKERQTRLRQLALFRALEKGLIQGTPGTPEAFQEERKKRLGASASIKVRNMASHFESLLKTEEIQIQRTGRSWSIAKWDERHFHDVDDAASECDADPRLWHSPSVTSECEYESKAVRGINKLAKMQYVGEAPQRQAIQPGRLVRDNAARSMGSRWERPIPPRSRRVAIRRGADHGGESDSEDEDYDEDFDLEAAAEAMALQINQAESENPAANWASEMATAFNFSAEDLTQAADSDRAEVAAASHAPVPSDEELESLAGAEAQVSSEAADEKPAELPKKAVAKVSSRFLEEIARKQEEERQLKATRAPESRPAPIRALRDPQGPEPGADAGLPEEPKAGPKRPSKVNTSFLQELESVLGRRTSTTAEDAKLEAKPSSDLPAEGRKAGLRPKSFLMELQEKLSARNPGASVQPVHAPAADACEEAAPARSWLAEKMAIPVPPPPPPLPAYLQKRQKQEQEATGITQGGAGDIHEEKQVEPEERATLADEAQEDQEEGPGAAEAEGTEPSEHEHEDSETFGAEDNAVHYTDQEESMEEDIEELVMEQPARAVQEGLEALSLQKADAALTMELAPEQHELEASPEAMAERMVEPMEDPAAEVAAEPMAEPIAEPAPESMPGPGVEPMAEPTPEPAPEPLAEPVAEPAAEMGPADSSLSTGPITEPVVETGAESDVTPSKKMWRQQAFVDSSMEEYAEEVQAALESDSETEEQWEGLRMAALRRQRKMQAAKQQLPEVASAPAPVMAPTEALSATSSGGSADSAEQAADDAADGGVLLRRLRITKRGLILNPFMSPISEESPNKAAAAEDAGAFALEPVATAPVEHAKAPRGETHEPHLDEQVVEGSTSKPVVRPEGSFLCFFDWSKDAPIVVDDDSLETGSMASFRLSSSMGREVSAYLAAEAAKAVAVGALPTRPSTPNLSRAQTGPRNLRKIRTAASEGDGASVSGTPLLPQRGWLKPSVRQKGATPKGPNNAVSFEAKSGGMLGQGSKRRVIPDPSGEGQSAIRSTAAPPLSPFRVFGLRKTSSSSSLARPKTAEGKVRPRGSSPAKGVPEPWGMEQNWETMTPDEMEEALKRAMMAHPGCFGPSPAVV